MQQFRTVPSFYWKARNLSEEAILSIKITKLHLRSWRCSNLLPLPAASSGRPCCIRWIRCTCQGRGWSWLSLRGWIWGCFIISCRSRRSALLRKATSVLITFDRGRGIGHWGSFFAAGAWSWSDRGSRLRFSGSAFAARWIYPIRRSWGNTARNFSRRGWWWALSQPRISVTLS